MAQATAQLELWDLGQIPPAARLYPQLRYMGNKARLLPWIHSILCRLEFESALDAFSGTGCVAYMLKTMGKRVVANDFLAFTHQLTLATIENRRFKLLPRYCDALLKSNPRRETFIEQTFKDIFYTPTDLRFLDNLWANLNSLPTRYHRALALAALVRACIKRQPRGVFTVAGDRQNYDDGRRDLRLSLREHFLESVELFNALVHDNGRDNLAVRSDVAALDASDLDLVYMDPPYVPRADDNCYIKRYHFIEGLMSYWREEGAQVIESTKVKKIPKRYTPFSYRRTCMEAFDGMFRRFRRSILVLSYSSNGYPDLELLHRLMRQYKSQVQVFEKEHRYHFGTHNGVSQNRATVSEYLIVGK